MIPIEELLLYSGGFVVYVILALHSMSAVSRLRDFGFGYSVLAYAYFISIVFGIPFVFVTYMLARY